MLAPMSNDDIEALIARIRALLPEKLEEVAEAVEWLETDDFFEVPPEAWPGIERGLADADAGRFASKEEVAEVFSKARRR